MNYIERIKKSFEERGYKIVLVLDDIMYMMYNNEVVEYKLF